MSSIDTLNIFSVSVVCNSNAMRSAVSMVYAEHISPTIVGKV